MLPRGNCLLGVVTMVWRSDLASNDDLALAALAQCQRSDIAVPRRLATSGFNDLEAPPGRVRRR